MSRGSWRWTAALAALLLACGTSVTPEELEAEAADCPAHPAMPLAPGLGPLVGLNAYYLQEEGARAVREGRELSPAMEEVYAKAAALGAGFVRTNAFNDAAEKVGDTAIQVAPLEYDESSLRGLDLVLARASAHGLRLVLPLGNYWDAYGGTRRYVEWAGLPAAREGDPRFFTDRAVIEHYKEHVRRTLDRVNTVDGRRYGDHPAVLAWELLNEPRNTGLDAEGNELRAWVDEVAARVKSLAPSHRVGTGEEGFDPPSRAYETSFWSETAPELFGVHGQFARNLASPWIDFGGIHLFPEAWGFAPDRTAAAGARWLSEHAAIARALGKPLLVGEFALRNDGAFSLPERRAVYRGWLQCARKAGIGGIAPWMFANDARPDAWDRHTFYFRDGTAPADPGNRYADLVLEASAR